MAKQKAVMNPVEMINYTHSCQYYIFPAQFPLIVCDMSMIVKVGILCSLLL